MVDCELADCLTVDCIFDRLGCLVVDCERWLTLTVSLLTVDSLTMDCIFDRLGCLVVDCLRWLTVSLPTVQCGLSQWTACD